MKNVYVLILALTVFGCSTSRERMAGERSLAADVAAESNFKGTCNNPNNEYIQFTNPAVKIWLKKTDGGFKMFLQNRLWVKDDQKNDLGKENENAHMVRTISLKNQALTFKDRFLDGSHFSGTNYDLNSVTFGFAVTEDLFLSKVGVAGAPERSTINGLRDCVNEHKSIFGIKDVL
jgi:hypothetical protein